MNVCKNVALFGECMLELQGTAFGAMRQSYGGDTFNTAVYLARCAGESVCAWYASAVGDDQLSADLLRHWGADGLELGLVRRINGRMPGLYMILVDGRGERSFSFWRDTSAATAYFDIDVTPLEERAAQWDALYLSGISLAILPQAGRERLFALAAAMRARGAAVAFDSNYRPRLWPRIDDARSAFDRAFALASMAFVSTDDHQALFGLSSLDRAVVAAQGLPTPELLIKRGAAATLVRSPGLEWQCVPTDSVANVVDTTAAGDSFAAGYLSRRLRGADAVEATSFGNRLAARVIQYPGALIPTSAMSDLMTAS